MRSGKTRWWAWTAAVIGVWGIGALASPDVAAHFFLEEPASWRVQDSSGNPQKTGPCGNDGSAAETGTVTAYMAGETITIRLRETIFHPGHYRVALAVNDRSELPAPPPVTPGSTACGSTEIMDPPVFPVLADGVLPHTSPLSGEQTIEVTLPSDVTCENCTLQVIQWMSNHGAPCFYYHCADISIAEVVVDTDAGVPPGDDAGPTPMVDAGTTPGTDAGGTVRRDGGATIGPTRPETDRGCCTVAPGAQRDPLGAFAFAALVVAIAAVRRRRSR